MYLYIAKIFKDFDIYIYIETVPKMETFVPHVLIIRCMHIVLAC